MATISDVTDVEATLTRLVEREGGPFVVRLAREPGRRDSRFAHLFSGQVADAEPIGHHRSSVTQSGVAHDPAERTSISAPEVTFPASRNEERLSKLEEEVQSLRAELSELKNRLGE